MIRFEALHDLYNRLALLSEDQLWIDSVDEPLQDEIIRLNTVVQLGKRGIDSDEVSLGEYAPLSVAIRSDLGLQTSFIDFKITGEYWDSWDIAVDKQTITIEVDDLRFNELVHELQFSEDHVGLTDFNMDIIQRILLENYVSNIRQQILQ